jgi:phosphohistidine swiveling domain-containing protein
MIKKEGFVKTVRRLYPPFFVSLIMEGSKNYDLYRDLLNERFAIRHIVQSKFYFYYFQAELDLGVKLTMDAWSDVNKFRLAEKIIREREKELIASTKKTFQEYCQAYHRYMPALILPWVIDAAVNKKARELLGKNFSAERVEELMDILNIPEEDNFVKKEVYDLLHAENLNAHVKEYEWVKSRYGQHNPYTVEEARESLAAIDKNKFLKEWDDEKAKLKKTLDFLKWELKEDFHWIELMQFIIYYRTQRTDIMNKSGYLAIPILTEFAQTLGLEYEDLLYCTYEELTERKIPNKDLITERKKNCVMVKEEDSIRCVSGKEAEEINSTFKEDVENVSEFKGQIACKGKVNGKVKIVMCKEDYEKISEGDVLVTTMTTPDMVPIMKKCAAFITEEGGITCHAAIISRELKTPCIIGTKIAVSVLKDNDLVEVDADSGIVRKLLNTPQ